jgi:hypothetical protein
MTMPDISIRPFPPLEERVKSPPPRMEMGSAWDVIAKKEDVFSELSALLQELDENPSMRSCAVLRAIERGRTELTRTPADAPLSSPMAVSLQDLSVLLRAVLSRLR